MYQAWICEGCSRFNKFLNDIWSCPGCNKEICEKCFSKLAHCHECAKGKTEEDLKIAANAAGWDFD